LLDATTLRDETVVRLFVRFGKIVMCDSCAALAVVLLLGASSVALHGARTTTATTASPRTTDPAPSTTSSADDKALPDGREVRVNGDQQGMLTAK
jgi:hypothetical protein